MTPAIRPLGLAAALLIAGCGKATDPSLIVASGHVEATDVHVSAKLAGRLESFALREGDTVAAGQDLARLETIDTRLALQTAGAEREQAAAELRLRLAGSRREEVAEMQGQVGSAEAELLGAQRDLDRFQELLDRGSGTAKARDDARTRRDVAAGRVESLKQGLARLRSGSRPQEIEVAEARLASAQARIAQLEQKLQDAVVKSPAAGVITEKVAEAGELVQPGAVLCVVTDLADAWLTVYVAEPDLGRIRMGQEAEVFTDDGQTRKGRITYVASRAEFTPKNVQTRDERVKLVFKVKVGLDNTDALFKPGMPAEARFRAAGAGQ